MLWTGRTRPWHPGCLNFRNEETKTQGGRGGTKKISGCFKRDPSRLEDQGRILARGSILNGFWEMVGGSKNLEHGVSSVLEMGVGCPDPRVEIFHRKGKLGPDREGRGDAREYSPSPCMQAFKAGSPRQSWPSRRLLTGCYLTQFSSFLCIIKHPPWARHCARCQS